MTFRLSHAKTWPHASARSCRVPGADRAARATLCRLAGEKPRRTSKNATAAAPPTRHCRSSRPHSTRHEAAHHWDARKPAGDGTSGDHPRASCRRPTRRCRWKPRLSRPAAITSRTFRSLPAVARGCLQRKSRSISLNGEIDVAVHSMKDLPTVLPDGLDDWRACRRAKMPMTCLFRKSSNRFRSCRMGARVATSSIRRRAQLLAQRPDLQIEEIRGNVETRLRKLAENDAL